MMNSQDICDSALAPVLTTPIDSIDYNMCHKYRGICLIFDNEKFSPTGITRNLSDRVGSLVDSTKLNQTFTNLGFEVVIRRDFTTAAIRETLAQLSMFDHSESDCFVCIVMSHGEHGHLYSFDGRYAIDHLFSNFLKCPTLVGKPKLFFVQACQGERLDHGIPVYTADSTDSATYFKIPTYADFLIAYSTLPGFYSFRNTEKGSWFIKSLCEVLDEFHLEYDLVAMLTLVNQKVASYQSTAIRQEHSGMKQMPCITSMLTRRVFLRPKPIQI